MKAILPLLAAAIISLNGPVKARSLNTIREFGSVGLCAHPNSLPFASKAGNPPGFQVELGQALARELGVALRLDWIITQYQMRSAGCDVVLDVIADREAQGETRLAISNPYYRTGVTLAVASTSQLTSFKSLNENVAVGMVRPDKALRDAIDEIMARLRADGTVERIYRRYCVTLQSPK